MRRPFLLLHSDTEALQLLRTPGFHKAVQSLQRRVYRLRYGTPPEEMGGTKIDEGPSFLQHFKDELRDQIRGDPRKR